MYVKPTAPRSIGGLVDDAVKLYRSGFSKSWVLALLGQIMLAVPVYIIQTHFAAVPVPRGNPLAALEVLKSPSFWISYLAAAILFVGIQNALLSRMDAVAGARDETLGQSMTVGFRLLPRTLLMFLAIGAVGAIGSLIVGVIATMVSALPIVKVILVAAFFGLAVYAWGRVFLANTALVVEDAAVFQSLEISWSLIKNHWWRTATVYSVAVIMALAFYFVVAVASGIVLALLHGSAFVTGVLSEAISIAGGTLLMAFIPSVLLTMYYDLKLRKDGTDLASRVNALARQ